jgi:hypothetical protein
MYMVLTGKTRASAPQQAQGLRDQGMAEMGQRHVSAATRQIRIEGHRAALSAGGMVQAARADLPASGQLRPIKHPHGIMAATDTRTIDSKRDSS